MIEKYVYKVAFFAVIYLIILFSICAIYNATRPVEKPFQASYQISSVTGIVTATQKWWKSIFKMYNSKTQQSKLT